MIPIDNTVYTAPMTPEQRGWFFAEYQQASKDEAIGVLLALFLGSFGIHHFYLRRDGLGILYLLLSWTGIPAILGFIECFLMPGRVRQYNAMQAAYIASRILATDQSAYAATGSHCPSCAAAIDPAATFCTHCGAAIHTTTAAIQPAT